MMSFVLNNQTLNYNASNSVKNWSASVTELVSWCFKSGSKCDITVKYRCPIASALDMTVPVNNSHKQKIVTKYGNKNLFFFH